MTEEEIAQKIFEAIASNDLKKIDELGFNRTVNTDKHLVWERKRDDASALLDLLTISEEDKNEGRTYSRDQLIAGL